MNMTRKQSLIAALALLMSSFAMAHPDHESASMLSGLIAGALHPLLGLDHLLVLLLTGALMAQTPAKQVRLVPLCFVGLMATGFFTAHLGVHAISAGTIELLISTSLVVGAIFLLVGQLAQRRFNKISSLNRFGAWVMTSFAVFHGFAHGLEVPAGAAASGFLFGFTAVSFCLIFATAWASGRSQASVGAMVS